MKRFIVIIIVLACLLTFSACTADLEREENLRIFNMFELSIDDFSVTPLDYTYMYGKVTRKFQNGDTYILLAQAEGYNGILKIAVLIRELKIVSIKGYEVRETENYGMRAFEEPYLQQFYGQDIIRNGPLIGGKTPGENIHVVAVTQATYSSNAVLSSVNAIIAYFNIGEEEEDKSF